MEDSSWIYRLGPRGTSRKPGPFRHKCADCCLTSPVLSVEGVGGGVSPGLSFGDVGKAAGGNTVMAPSPFVWLPSRFSFGVVDGRATRIFSPVF